MTITVMDLLLWLPIIVITELLILGLNRRRR